MVKKEIDLVIGGPDMSGTNTQVMDLIDFFRSKGITVRDMRGTEMDALFHAKIFEEHNKKYLNLKEFESDENVLLEDKDKIMRKMMDLMRGGNTNEDLRIASFLDNGVSTFVDPDSADVWVFEEPTKRGSGQVNRTIEQWRSNYGSSIDPIAAAYTHAVYRVDEFLRFRKILRDKKKIIIRSRSEESGCYQISHDKRLPNGISRKQYFELPGHKIAFAYPPTHIFIAHAPADWSKDDYFKMWKERSGDRDADDYETNADYMLLVNNRYATEWFEEFYKEGCSMHGGKMPRIYRFDMRAPKDQLKEQMVNKLKMILEID
ncbi:MAG: hypothetical protein ABIE94_05630 [archaeon]